MTNKKFAILVAVVVFVSFMRIGGAQSGFVTTALPPATISGCVWPPTPNSVVQGTLFCIYGTSTTPGLAIAVNGGPFAAVPMSQAAAGVASFNGRTGAVTMTKGDITATGISATATVSAPTAAVTLQ